MLATFQHYADHMMPIVDALRAHDVEVDCWTTRNEALWAEKVNKAHYHREHPDYWMVAGSVDYKLVPKDGRIIYVEHGAGQTYAADNGGIEHAESYSNGTLDRVALFLCPNVYVTNRRAKNHPDAISRLVGVPKMDWLHEHLMRGDTGSNIVAFAFHWDCQVCPESQSAWEHYRSSMTKINLALRRSRLRVVATAHPRIAQRVKYHTERSGIEFWDSEDVLAKAAVLVVDNSSLGYEFASLDRPTVWMNAPWYRRDVHHGLRFWEAIPGEQVDEPEQIPDAVLRALNDDPYAKQRDVINAYVCPLRDGQAAERAALSILALPVFTASV